MSDSEEMGHALENLLILDKIIGYMDVDELLKCRLISQQWNSSCVRHLKANNSYTIKLTEAILPEYVNFLKTRENSLEWCNKYRVSLNLRHAESWLVESLTDASVILQIFGMQPLKTLWNTIRNTERLKPWCNTAEKMVLGRGLDLSVLKKENLLQNIKELEISLDSSTLPYSEILGFEFLSLESLKVTVHDHLTKLDWQCLKEFVLKNCPNLRTFRFNLVEDGKIFWACLCNSCEEYDNLRNMFPEIKFSFD